MDEKTQHGYLVLADISGFTSYLAKVELEHAHEILTDLLVTIVKEFKTLLTISKLEGDAVFAYSLEEKTPGGERILELVENTYIAFRRQRETSRRNTTCTCNACKAIPSLDLKFFIHHGDYIIQEVSGIHELVGSDVNMIHRLMKNHITENTGWNAYILFTSQAFQHMTVRPEGLHEQMEAYEYLGDIRTLSLNLHERYKTLIEAQRVIISPEEADFVFSFDFQAPPPVIWHWLTDTEKKNLLTEGEAVFTAQSRPGGRTGAGASNHCAHGKNLKGSLIETILDWRPFEYFTSDAEEGKSHMRQTYRLEPLSDGNETRLHMSMIMISPKLPRLIRRPMLKMIMTKMASEQCHGIASHLAMEENKEIDTPIPQRGTLLASKK